ncbi:MAG: transcription antitermination factor NusB [Clostridia bacterium]|nr:transcription antitermination factor NusB [Clostridia bacterium]
MKRNEAREQAFLLLFSGAFHPDCSAEELIDNVSEAGEYESDAYTLRLINGVMDNEQQLDEVITAKLNKWKLSRLPKTSLAILRLGTYEILYCEDVLDSVAINEAVELAKRFGSPKDYAFINGVLGNIARSKTCE